MASSILRPITLEFNPDIILVSAGFDIYMDDPLGGMKVTPDGFAGMTRSLMELASECCKGRMVATLEGGYHLQGLRDSVKAVLKELADLSRTNTADLISKADKSLLNDIIGHIKKTHGQYWNG